MADQNTDHKKVPGAIYLNGNRWWWRVRLPGQSKRKAIPLIPEGGTYATKDYGTALDIAEKEWKKAHKHAVNKRRPTVRTISDLVATYLEHCRGFYVDADGNETKEVYRHELGTRPLVKRYGKQRADEFGPLALQELRDYLIEERGLARKTINDRISVIQTMYKWAASQELVPVQVYQSLATVARLRAGRSKAREPRQIKSVTDDQVGAVVEAAPPVVKDMIRLQHLTGMRSGELIIMRPCDIQTDRKFGAGEDSEIPIWIYVPTRHKTQGRGHDRHVVLGPKAQTILAPYMKRGPFEYLFSPAESEEQRYEQRNRERKIKRSYGNTRGTNRKQNPKQKAGEHYTVHSYRRAVERACDQAWPPPKKMIDEQDKDGILAWRKSHRWTPHQLRHTVATLVDEAFGTGDAGALLGQRSRSVTKGYVEERLERAMKVAAKIG